MGQQVINKNFNRYCLILLATIIGISLLCLSIPRLYSSGQYLPVETALKNHWSKGSIRTERFPSLIEHTESSLAILNDSRYWQGLGWLHYLYAGAMGTKTEQGKDELILSEQAFINQLNSSPADSAEWLRLGWVRALLSRPARQVMDVWSMSVNTGRAEHHLLVDRLELGLRIADACNDFELSLMRDQIVLAWKYRRNDMQRALIADRLDIETIDGLLSLTEPDLMREMKETYERYH